MVISHLFMCFSFQTFINSICVLSINQNINSQSNFSLSLLSFSFSSLLFHAFFLSYHSFIILISSFVNIFCCIASTVKSRAIPGPFIYENIVKTVLLAIRNYIPWINLPESDDENEIKFQAGLRQDQFSIVGVSNFSNLLYGSRCQFTSSCLKHNENNCYICYIFCILYT